MTLTSDILSGLGSQQHNGRPVLDHLEEECFKLLCFLPFKKIIVLDTSFSPHNAYHFGIGFLISLLSS